MSASDAARKKGSKPLALAVVAALGLVVSALTSDAEAQIIDIPLGDAADFAVLGATSVTNAHERS